MDSRLSRVVYILSEWRVLENTIKCVSTVAPDDLLKDTSQEGMHNFLTKLKSYQNRLFNDYTHFVVPLSDTDEQNSETMISVFVRFSYISILAGLNRLIGAYETYIASYANDRIQQNYSFFSTVLLPSCDIYHDKDTGLELVADLLHKLYKDCFILHLNKQCHVNSQPCINTSTNHAADSIICKTNKQMNAILNYAAKLASYPVLPPNVTGHLASTVIRNDLGNLQLNQPSVESRGYVTSATDPRTCIACQVDLLSTGETDRVQQRLKNRCECLFQRKHDSYFEQAYVARAQAIVRLLIMQNAGSCHCTIHNNIFKCNMKKLKTLLDRIHVE